MRAGRIAFWFLCAAVGILTSGAADELPRGVPRTVWPDGSVYVDPMFTTPAYQREAFELVLREANLVAKELHLREKLPITEGDVVERYIVPFGYGVKTKSIGNITTKNYCYNVKDGSKLSDVVIVNYDQTCLRYEEGYKVPIKQMDTNAAYRLATQWLAAVSIDVKNLNRDCEARAAPTTFWNDVSRLGEVPKGPKFVPIYYVWWTSARNRADGYGCVVSVELFLPTKQLLQLYTYDPKYILRKPLVFTNLPSLFPQTNAPVTVITNWPPVQYPSAPESN